MKIFEFVFIYSIKKAPVYYHAGTREVPGEKKDDAIATFKDMMRSRRSRT
jgi:hypothetical protein